MLHLRCLVYPDEEEQYILLNSMRCERKNDQLCAEEVHSMRQGILQAPIPYEEAFHQGLRCADVLFSSVQRQSAASRSACEVLQVLRQGIGAQTE